MRPLTWGKRSLDNYCGVKAQRAARFVSAPEHANGPHFGPARLLFDATPQKSFGSREATIHARSSSYCGSEFGTSLNIDKFY